jgi:hypothetical protein
MHSQISVKSTFNPQRLKKPGETSVANHKMRLMAIKFFTTGGIEPRKEDL